MDVSAISIAEAECLLEDFEQRAGLILAVSGGPDSLAMMALVARWRGKGARPPAIVATVNHGLRAEAADEARHTAAIAHNLNMPHETLAVDAEAPRANLQSWARDQRYRLLCDLAKKTGFDTIVTAHHADDQAETFLIRLARGSGVTGLSAIARQTERAGITIMRPFLTIPRSRLAATVREMGLTPITDPTNTDRRFQRPRIRALMPALAREGLTRDRLVKTADRMRRADDALAHFTRCRLRKDLHISRAGYVEGDVETLLAPPDDIALRVLSWTARAVGGEVYPGRLARLEALLGSLRSGDVRRTYSGVVFERRSGQFLACRERGRRPIPAVVLEPGTTEVWDGRFAIAASEGAPAALIRRLGASLAKCVFGRTENAPPKAALRTMPGLFIGGELVATPISDGDSRDFWTWTFPAGAAGRIGPISIDPGEAM